jgi:hypothetical protein
MEEGVVEIKTAMISALMIGGVISPLVTKNATGRKPDQQVGERLTIPFSDKSEQLWMDKKALQAPKRLRVLILYIYIYIFGPIARSRPNSD